MEDEVDVTRRLLAAAATAIAAAAVVAPPVSSFAAAPPTDVTTVVSASEITARVEEKREHARLRIILVFGGLGAARAGRLEVLSFGGGGEEEGESSSAAAAEEEEQKKGKEKGEFDQGQHKGEE